MASKKKISIYIDGSNFYFSVKKTFNCKTEIEKLNIIFGRLEKRKRDGEIYYIEKASDVNLALDLVLDAQKGIYERAYLISNDGDFSGAVKSAIDLGKEIIYVAIGNKKSISHHLKKVASPTFYITEGFIQGCKL